MNFKKYSDNLLYSSFNHTNDCVVFGTLNGFYVYTVSPFKKIISRKIMGGVSIVKMLYKSNIIVFVGNDNTSLYPDNKLIIWDDDKQKVIGEIAFNEKIINFILSKTNIIIILYKKIYIYNFKNLNLIKTYNTNNNTLGLCKVFNDLIIYPTNNIGEITISNYKVKNCNNTKSIKCHENKIQLFNIDKSGQYLVTSSTKGTIIRIYNLQTFDIVKELRRGSDYTTIVDLNFSPDLKYLLCSSIKGTIHIYNMSFNNNTNMFTYLLPEYFNSDWSIIKFYLNNISYSTFIEENTNNIITICNDGCFYNLLLNIEENCGNINNTYKFILDNDPFSN